MSTNTPTPTDLLNQMQGLTVTEGWDVVNAMDAGTLNQLLQQQYVQKAYNQQNLPPINGSVTISSSMFGTVIAQLVDVVLGPPLLMVDPALDPKQVKLQINFVSGAVNLVTEIAGISIVTSSQMIIPANQYSLQGNVPLSTLQGSVTDQQIITLDITNGSSFVANLGIGSATETLLGEYFLTYLQTQAGSLSYSLGTVSTQSNGTDLVPVLFDFATQIDPNNPNDDGRLLIFIATQYNPVAGSGTSLSLLNLVPTGYSTCLIISSKVLFAGILQSFFQSQLGSVNPQFSATQSSAGAAYSLKLTSGSLNAGSFYQRGGSGTLYFSADYDPSYYCPPQANVLVPLNGLQISPKNNAIQLNWNGFWAQSWAKQEITLYGTPPCGQDSDSMSSTLSSTNIGTADPTTDLISFNSPAGTTIIVNFGQQLWGFFGSDTNIIDEFLSQIQEQVNRELSFLFNFNLPSINAFVVSNLLFSQNNLLALQTADVPGDLVSFGNLKTSSLVVSPTQLTLSSSQSQSFAVTQNGQPFTTAQWVLTPSGAGTLSNSGVYTAPTTIGQAQQVVITAVNPSDATDSASALVTLIPTGVSVTPYLVIMVAGQTPQPFVAAIEGASGTAVNWSINSNVGSINSTGQYTPPTTVTESQSVTVIATSQTDSSVQGTATVVLLPAPANGLAVSPSYVSLQEGQQQTFSVVGETVNWEIVPALGNITSDGLYTDPTSINQVQGVVVIATNPQNPSIIGTAVIGLVP